MNAFNSIINLTQLGSSNQSTDYSLNLSNYNGMNNVNNINNLNNINAVGKLGALNSMNSHNSTSNLDTTITNMTNLSYFNDFNNVNLSNSSTLSNISNISNSQNMNSQNNTSNNSHMMQNNNYTGGYNNLNTNPMFYLNYYLSMMNYPLQYNSKFEQDLTASTAFTPYLANNKPMDMSHQNFIPDSQNNFTKIKDSKPTKPKTQSKRGKQASMSTAASKIDLMEDKKVIDTMNELNFDILELYNPTDDLIGFKRKGIPTIQDFDSLLKKRQLENHYGIN